MVIDPQGNITVCCNYTDRKSLGHINDVDDIADFFLGDSYTELRSMFKNGWKANPSCELCSKHVLGLFTPIIHSQGFNPRGAGLQYLEFSTSNVCNQTCATCSSYFSSKWTKLNSIFDIDDQPNESFSLSDRNIDSIIDVLPTLKEIQIKGGEPFADMKNLRVLKALVDVNPSCHVRICSNMQMVPKAFIDVIKKLELVDISASVDGVGRRFDWIRGGHFNKVIDNINRVSDAIGQPIHVEPCISVYNINNLREIYDYFEYLPSAQLNKIYNVVQWPAFLSPIGIFNQQELNDMVSRQFDDIRSNCDVEALYHMEALPPDQNLIDKHIDFTNRMNGVRGFNLEDVV
jgi:hypothetical protein